MERQSNMKSKQPIILTGTAGFIGYHVASRLLARGERVIGFDALTPYNDPKLKRLRLSLLKKHRTFTFVQGDLTDFKKFELLVRKTRPKAIAHLAAQAGVRYSLESPQSYVDANVLGSTNVFEAARLHRVPVVYASSSSVYGERTGTFSEDDRTDSPVSIYAATKKATEVLAHAYNTLYGLPLIGLRYFTVYGPWIRTDLALFIFARHLVKGTPISLFAKGKGKRSFTHISLVVDGTCAALARIKKGHTIYNLGSERSIETKKVLTRLARELGVTPQVRLLPPQKGDVLLTRASGVKIVRELKIRPRVSLEEGIAEFARWFKENQKMLLSLRDMHSRQ